MAATSSPEPSCHSFTLHLLIYLLYEVDVYEIENIVREQDLRITEAVSEERRAQGTNEDFKCRHLITFSFFLSHFVTLALFSLRHLNFEGTLNLCFTPVSG